MTQEELRAKETKEIDLIDLMIEMLLHWRGLIIAILIGGILLGGYSVYKSNNAHNSAVAQAEKAQKEKEQLLAGNIDLDNIIADLKLQAASLSENMTEKSKSNVDAALLYAEQIDTMESYFSSSVLMNVDLNKLPTGDILVSVIADADKKADICTAYEKLLSSSELYNYVSEKCGYGSEVGELITIGLNKSYSSNAKTVLNLNDGIEESLLVRCYAESLDKCEAIESAVKDFLEVKKAELKTQIGQHELLVSVGAVTALYNEDLLNSKNTKQTSMISNKTNLIKLTDTFSAEEKQLYELKNKIAHEEMQKKAIEDKKIDIPAVGVSKKQLAIGMVGGLFVYAAIICLAYIFSQKIKDSDDFTTTFGTRQLGKVYGTREFKKPLGFIDRWIYSFKRHGRRKIDNAEACDIIATNTALTAAKAEIGKLGIICASGVDNADSKIVGKLGTALKKEGIESKILPNILYSNEEAYSLKDMDAVVLVATPEQSKYNEVWDVIEVLENRKIKILGGIMA